MPDFISKASFLSYSASRSSSSRSVPQYISLKYDNLHIILYIFITLAIRNSKIGFSLSLKFDGGAAPLFHITPKVSWQNNRQFFFSLLLEVKPPNDRGCPSSVSRLVDLAKGGIFTSMLLSEHKFSETIVLIGAWK